MARNNKKQGKTNPQNSPTQSKKDAVLGTKKTNHSQILLFTAVTVAVLGAVAALAMWSSGGNPAVEAQAAVDVDTHQTQAAAPNDQVAFPVSEFADGAARYYEHQGLGGDTIRYFVLQSSDGVIRAAFDACDVCWQAGKGYAQQGDNMVCRNCGRRFPSISVNEVQGGCNPAPLNRRIENGQVVIEVKDILKGNRYFDFT